jgi:hypothetical protein
LIFGNDYSAKVSRQLITKDRDSGPNLSSPKPQIFASFAAFCSNPLCFLLFKFLPGDPGVMLYVCPRRSCFEPGLNILIRFLRFSDLVPSNGVAGSVVATIHGECGYAESGKH